MAIDCSLMENTGFHVMLQTRTYSSTAGSPTQGVVAGVRFVPRFCFCFVVCFCVCVCGLIYRKGEGCLFMCVKVKMFYDGLGRTSTQKGLDPFKTAFVHTGSNPAPRAIPKGSEKLVFEEFSLKA